MRWQIKKRIIAFVLSAAVCSGFLTGMSSTYKTARADSLASLKNQYTQLQEQQQQLQKTLDGLSSQVSSEKQKKDVLDKNAAVLKQQITVLNSQISATSAQLKSESDQIDATQKQVEQYTTEYKEQVVAIYEAGSATKLELLMTAKSIPEFLSRFQIINDISDYDKDLITNLTQSEAKLKNEKSNLQSEMTNLQSSENSLAAKKDVLNAQLTQENALVAQLQKNANDVQQQTDAVAEKARETDDQINAEIAKEAQARALELKKQQQQQQAGQPGAQAPQGGSVNAGYIVNFAENYEGTPYVFSSADPSVGFDCSGFVQYVYANAAGIYLPHSAAGQAGYGTPVSSGSLEPGDLVFFNVTGGGIDHVGIYVGNDEFIEANDGASSGRYVMVTGLFSSSYWGPKFVTARRILN